EGIWIHASGSRLDACRRLSAGRPNRGRRPAGGAPAAKSACLQQTGTDLRKQPSGQSHAFTGTRYNGWARTGAGTAKRGGQGAFRSYLVQHAYHRLVIDRNRRVLRKKPTGRRNPCGFQIGETIGKCADQRVSEKHSPSPFGESAGGDHPQ